MLDVLVVELPVLDIADVEVISCLKVDHFLLEQPCFRYQLLLQINRQEILSVLLPYVQMRLQSTQQTFTLLLLVYNLWTLLQPLCK